MIHRLLLALLVALTLGACGGPKQGPKESAEEFFAQCSSGKIAEAYQSSSRVFQLERTEKYFEARVRDLGLDQTKSVQWGDPEARGDIQRLKGTFKVESGELILNITMALENGKWRLLGAKKDGENLDTFTVITRSKDSQADRDKAILEPVATAIPNERQLQQLVEKTIMDFQDAIERNEFADFFANVSDRWKYRGKDPRLLNYTGTDPRRIQESDPENSSKRITVEALRANFEPFVRAQVNLKPIKGKPMTLNKPAHLTSDGVLTLDGNYKDFVFQGSFPPQSRHLTFKLEYVFEGSSWRLFGITLNLERPPGTN